MRHELRYGSGSHKIRLWDTPSKQSLKARSKFAGDWVVSRTAFIDLEIYDCVRNHRHQTNKTRHCLPTTNSALPQQCGIPRTGFATWASTITSIEAATRWENTTQGRCNQFTHMPTYGANAGDPHKIDGQKNAQHIKASMVSIGNPHQQE